MWWAALRSAALWFFWLAWNAATIPKPIHPEATKALIWSQMKIYLRAGWKKQKAKIKDSAVEEVWARYLFQTEFGSYDRAFFIDEELQLQVERPPPEPD